VDGFHPQIGLGHDLIGSSESALLIWRYIYERNSNRTTGRLLLFLSSIINWAGITTVKCSDV